MIGLIQELPKLNPRAHRRGSEHLATLSCPILSYVHSSLHSFNNYSPLLVLFFSNSTKNLVIYLMLFFQLSASYFL